MAVIEINGEKIEVEDGKMLIEAADRLNIHIPRFCYHKKLSVAANCRMCLVEVENAPKPLPACATPIRDGMRVWTQSAKTVESQKSVMEFLLINHPLDCPICDQGGECELQDLSMGYGRDVSHYSQPKRVIEDKDIGPLIQTDMTRCIYCTRCVRFGEEIAGHRELGGTGRGEHTEIGTFIERHLNSEVSGNVIDLCPVGALASKPFLFTGRSWELKQTPSVSPHDCMGSNLYLHARRNTVMRVVPKENESINEIWISDRDRFSYEGLTVDRLTVPLIKYNHRWQEVSWEEALNYTVEKLQEIQRQKGSEALGALVSPNSTIEECYLVQKWFRAMGTHNIDHRLSQQDVRFQEHAPLFPNSGMQIPDMEDLSLVLLVGSDIQREQPVLSLRLRKMLKKGGKVCVINPIDFSFNFDVDEKEITPRGDLIAPLARIAKALLEYFPEDTQSISRLLAKVQPDPKALAIAQRFIANPQALIVLGAFSITHPQYSEIVYLARFISRVTGAKLAEFSKGANAAGAWLSGCVPHRLAGGQAVANNIGLSASQMYSSQSIAGYFLFNTEIELDSLAAKQSLESIANASTVVVVTPFFSQTYSELATIMLPLAPFSETEGTFVNVEGVWQTFAPAVDCLELARPGWKVLTMLGHRMGLKGFDYETPNAIREEVQASIAHSTLSGDWEEFPIEKLEGPNEDRIIRIAELPMYSTDSIVRRAKALQKAQEQTVAARLNSQLAKKLKLHSDKLHVLHQGIQMEVPYVIDERIPDDTVSIPVGVEEASLLGQPYSEVELRPLWQ